MWLVISCHPARGRVFHIRLNVASSFLLSPPVQYEPGVLEACMNLLQVSPQHQKNSRRDYLKRNDPVYVGRVVSAMVGHVFAQKTQRGKVLRANWFTPW